MEQVMNRMEGVLAPLAIKIGSNKLLKTVSSAFNMMMPIIIIGAMFSLLSMLQIKPYQDFLTATNIRPLLGIVSRFTTDVMAIYLAFSTAYAYLQNEGLPQDSILAGIISLMAFFIITPLSNVTIGENNVTMLAFTYLGSRGLFSALLVGLLTGFIYAFIIKHNWVIKMPEGVPPSVAKSFSALIPGFVIAAVFMTITGFFTAVTGITFGEWIYTIIATPLGSFSGSMYTFLFLNFLGSLFWFFGIHGGQVVMPFMMILFLQAGVENQTAFAAGMAMPHILTMGLTSFLMLGGIGNTIGLVINMFFFSKSERYKTLGKLAILPSICAINEPVMFGMPLILNPIMAIPFFLVPAINFLLTYFVMNIGLIGLPRLARGAFGTPLLLDSWLLIGVSGVIWQIVLIALTVLMYLPFFKVQDRLAYKEEQGEAK
ncbi:MAG: PTS transporter subunit EIIC [Erysipelotrichaceae bacterium]|nr:PTS transporter subunit EIIC [Erysipelotrichaceae bacterium]MDD3808856.1 PTS transporter subunit EIIC [Erysipelotrichaceae bacterium]